MSSMKLNELISGVDVISTNISPNREISGVTDSSKELFAGMLYIAHKGEHQNGEDYISEALSRGAVILTENPGMAHGEYVLCRSTREADAIISSNLNENPEKALKIIGVTGTNGKTSVCHMIYKLLTDEGKRASMSTTVGNYINGVFEAATMTTPKPQELYSLMKKARDANDEYFIMEVSSHALEYNKLAPITFQLSVFINLTPEHMDFHGDMESYAQAKAKLFKKSMISLVNYDSDHARYMYDSAQGERYCFSCKDEAADFSAINIKNNKMNGMEFDLISESCGLHISSPLIGEHNLQNTGISASAALLLGLDCKRIAMSLRTLKGVKGRLERVSFGYPFNIFIDYAHTPDAMEKLLITARGLEHKGNIIILFGCGGDRDTEKRALMGEIASRLADKLIITSDNPRSEDPEKIITDILSGVTNKEKTTVIINRKEAIEYGVSQLNSGDILLLAGKGHENYEINSKGKTYFSEIEIVNKCLERIKDQ